MFYAVRSRTYVFHMLSKTGILILNSLIGFWRFHSKNNFSISRMRIVLFCVNDGCWKFSVVLYSWFFQNIFFLAKVNEIKEMKTFYMQHFCKWSFGYYGESQDKECLILLISSQETTKATDRMVLREVGLRCISF